MPAILKFLPFGLALGTGRSSVAIALGEPAAPEVTEMPSMCHVDLDRLPSVMDFLLRIRLIPGANAENMSQLWAEPWTENQPHFCNEQSLRELLFSAPTIAFLLAGRARQCGWGAAELARLSALKRREILRVCGVGQAGEAAVKLCRRICVVGPRPSDADDIVDLLRRRTLVTALCHWSYITLPMVRALARLDEQDCEALSSCLQRPVATLTLTSVVELLEFASHRSGVDLIALRRSLVTKVSWGAVYRLLLRSVPFAPAPFGGAGLDPVKNYLELESEANTMRHCARQYLYDLMAGNRVMYRVLTPERATLMLRRSGLHGWILEEIKGPDNAQVEFETQRAVQSLLDEKLMDLE